MRGDLPPGGASVSHRAIADIVRAAVLGSYGVTGFASSPMDRLLAWLGIGHAGISIDRGEGGLRLGLDLEIAYGLPVAEVARQVDSAVRYAIRRALGRDIAELRITVDGLVVRPSVAERTESAASPRRSRRAKKDLASEDGASHDGGAPTDQSPDEPASGAGG